MLIFLLNWLVKLNFLFYLTLAFTTGNIHHISFVCACLVMIFTFCRYFLKNIEG